LADGPPHRKLLNVKFQSSSSLTISLLLCSLPTIPIPRPKTKNERKERCPNGQINRVHIASTSLQTPRRPIGKRTGWEKDLRRLYPHVRQDCNPNHSRHTVGITLARLPWPKPSRALEIHKRAVFCIGAISIRQADNRNLLPAISVLGPRHTGGCCEHIESAKWSQRCSYM